MDNSNPNFTDRKLVILLISLLVAGQGLFALDYINLNNAAIVVRPENISHTATATYLQQEILKRTGIRLSIVDRAPLDGSGSIILGLAEEYSTPSNLFVPAKNESFAIWIDSSNLKSPAVMLIGRDSRGVLFAAGHLLKILYLTGNYISIGSDVMLSSAPADEIRAQQIITNTQCEDGFFQWDKESDVQSFVNDMIIAGANGFEPTVPSLVDDYLEELGLDLYVKLKCQEIIDLAGKNDQEIISFFEEYSGIDHITTYGGDASGSLPPQSFFPHMERVIPLLLQGKSGLKWWYSNQCLEDHAKDHDEYIFDYIKEKRPPWLYGMVYGPWTKRGIREIREDLPSQYELRHFPEICHPRWCQYPVPEWDRIFAVVWPRNNSIYAMPTMMRDIYLATRENTIGALPYNHTGCYNDLNKFVWAFAGWKPEASVEEILEVYSRVFFAHDFQRSPFKNGSLDISREEIIDEAVTFVTKGLQLLEENWSGPLSKSRSTEEALKHWLTIAECMGGPQENWRVEMFLNKARIDAQVKRKYDFEMQLEREAYEIMINSGKDDISRTRKRVSEVLSLIDTEFQPKDDLLEEMGKMGLSGKFGDLEEITNNIYTSFNNRYWIIDRLEQCRTEADLLKLVNYEDPGEGGFYDNLGVAGEQQHLVGQHMWNSDPGFVYSPIEWVDNDNDSDDRHSQLTHALARYENPLKMKWCNLDQDAKYSIHVVYNGPFDIRIRCQTDDGLEIHDFIEKPGNEIVSFPVPASSTSDGELTLQWFQDTTDIMRGVSVSEIWLVKADSL